MGTFLHVRARDSDIAPEPQPTSRTSQLSSCDAFSLFNTRSTSISVSGRGMKIGGTSLTTMSRKSHSPIIYWTGILQGPGIRERERESEVSRGT